ncbi:MAG: hypothetical protein RIE86_05710 [Imperialibacter sp.]|uniref:hypothetical protein n=1 Tax=Imperialibacter sp. TaxID=2038411 RepID=UPI0032EE5675
MKTSGISEGFHQSGIFNMKNTEKQIADAIAKASGLSVTALGLRFDKVVVRVLGSIRDSLAPETPAGKVVIMTITAPIKLPAKTADALKGKILEALASGIPHEELNIAVFHNTVCLKVLNVSPHQGMKFLGLVHNPDTDPRLLLDLVSKWLSDDSR